MTNISTYKQTALTGDLYFLCSQYAKRMINRSERPAHLYLFLGKTVSETPNVMHAFGNDALDQIRTYVWFKHHLMTNFHDYDIPTLLQNMPLLFGMWLWNEIIHDMELSYDTYQWISLESLNTGRIAVKFVPLLFSDKQQFLAKKKIVIISHPAYLPELSPCNFFIFPKMKSSVRG